MKKKALRWMATLSVVLSLPSLVVGEEVVWRAAVLAPAAPATPEGPAATLGRPVPLGPTTDLAPVAYRAGASGAGNEVVRAQVGGDPLIPYPPPPPPPPSENASAVPSLPSVFPSAPVPPVGDPAMPAPPPPGAMTHTVGGPPDVPPPASGNPFPPGDYNSAVQPGAPVGPGWWEKLTGKFTLGDQSNCASRAPFQSDHNFDCMISPVTNPFFFEDPRSLTEVRPIFIYQSAPSGNPVFQGGHSEFFGLQARLAITERLSIVLNELGVASLNPKNPVPGVENDTGFSEVKAGAKYTFLRNTTTNTVAAAGLTFEFPVGSNRIGQNTGDLGLDPYATLGQHFRLPAGLGSLNFLGAMGYSFATDNQRAEFFHTSLHLDYNIANTNFFPLIEMNYFRYTRAGDVRALTFEGADLANFGSTDVGNRDLLTVAVGLRWKCSERFQIGGALEWPLTNHANTLTDFRATVDLIFRY